MTRKYVHWTEEEDSIIKNNWYIDIDSLSKLFPLRSKSSVQNRRSGLQKSGVVPNKLIEWTNKEKDILILFSDYSIEKLMIIFPCRSKGSIRSQQTRLRKMGHISPVYRLTKEEIAQKKKDWYLDQKSKGLIKNRKRTKEQRQMEYILNIKRAKERVKNWRLRNPDYKREMDRKTRLRNSPSSPRTGMWSKEEILILIENKDFTTIQLSFLLQRSYGAVIAKKHHLRKAGLIE